MRTRRRPLYASGRRRSLALAVVVAASVVTPLAVYGADQLAEPGDDIATTAGSALPTEETEVSLAGAPDAAGVDTDIAAGSAPVKEVTSDTPFSMVGVTWKGFNPEGVAAVRAQEPDGTWGPWYEAESVDAEGESTTGMGGTEPVFLGVNTTAVQIKMSGVDLGESSLADAPDAEASETAPADEDIADTRSTEQAPEPVAPSSSSPSSSLPAPTSAPARPATDDTDSGDDTRGADAADRADSAPPVPTRFADVKPVAETTDLTADDVTAVLLSPDDTPTPDPEAFGDITAAGGTGVDSDISVRQPSIISRSGWGANESIRCRNASYDNSLAAAVVHHTAGTNNYTRERSAEIVRGIYHYHARTLGWCDVGYNVLVDKYGQAFEGRHGGINRNVQGAHAGGFNGNTWGISMMGDHTSVPPSDATVRKVGEIIGWRLSVAGVDPKGTDTHYSEGTSYTKYARGTAVQLPNIFAHRDVGLTSCPGPAGYAKMGQIRDIAASYAKGGGNSGGGGGNSGGGSPSTPGTGGGGGGGGGETGSADLPSTITQGSIQEAVTTALRTVLGGGTLDPATLTRILTGGRTLADIPVDAGSVQAATGVNLGQIENLLSGDFATLARQLVSQLGPVLSGIQRYGDVSLVKHENGAVYSSPETGTHPVWGVIGDAWAAQGFEHGPLGLPVSAEAKRDDGTVAQRFVGGTLVFDPASGEITLEANP